MTNNRETTRQMMNTIFPEKILGLAGMRQYLESECWRCHKSPSGAHYWKDIHRQSGRFQCMFCGEKRAMGVDGAISSVGRAPSVKKLKSHIIRKL